MGVYIGDDPAFVFPSFIAAASEELLERAKEKFYEPFILFLRCLQGKTAEIKTSIFNPESASKTSRSADDFLVDVRFRLFFGGNGQLFLEQIKRADPMHRLLIFDSDKSNMFSDQTKQYEG